MRSSRSLIFAVVALLAGCTAGDVADSTTMVPVTEATTASTTTTTGQLTQTAIDLLDGSSLKLFGPTDLLLTGYFFVIDVPGIGSSNVDLAPGVDPADATSVDDVAVLEVDHGNGVRLWRADREGQPFYMSVDLGGWGAFLHVGNATAPERKVILSLADQLQGTVTEEGVVLSGDSPAVFTTYLRESGTDNRINVAANQCIRELIPGASRVEHPDRGEIVRRPAYASWCELDNDLEVTVSGTETFVDQVVEGLTLTRTSPPTDESGWHRIPHDEDVFGGAGDQVVTGLTAGPASLVAVGSEDTINGSQSLSWVSLDGRDWSRTDSPGLETAMEDVVWFEGGDLFVAVGHQVSEGAVWTSPNGNSWTRAALIPFENPAGGVEIESVTNAEHGLVAVGKEWYGEGESIPAVWTSVDGHTWTRAGLDLSTLPRNQYGQISEHGLVDVAVHGGDLYAVGYSWIDNIEPRLWTSRGGATWQEVDLKEDDARESILNAISVHDDGTLVMVGESDAAHVDSRAWVSNDGTRTWSKVEVETGNTGIPDLKDITHHPASGWVAVGTDASTRHRSGEATAAVWHMPESGDWERISPRAQAFWPHETQGSAGMTAVTTVDGAIVAGGIDGSDCETPLEFRLCDLDAAFWIRDPSS